MKTFSLTALLILVAVTSIAQAAEQWVGVGYGGRRIVSTDGRHWDITGEWQVDGKDDSNNLMGLAWGNGRYVAVGGGGWSRESQAGHILVSTDGREWRETLKLPNRINPLVFGGDTFVTAGPPDKTLYTSTDGETWKAGAKVPFEGWALWFRHAAYGNGTFVMMGECTPKKELYWALATRDGGSLEKFRTDLPQLRDLEFGNGRFVAVGHGGVVVTSADGVDWATGSVGADEKLDWLIWTGSKFLCGGKQTFESADGLAWKPVDFKPRGRPVWTDGTRFISTSWPGKMFYSPDGKQWDAGPGMTPNGINKVVLGGAQ